MLKHKVKLQCGMEAHIGEWNAWKGYSKQHGVHRVFCCYTWKRQIWEGKMNMHHLLTAVPLGTGEMEGGEVNFCTWLKSRFFSCIPAGQRWEEAGGNRSRINQKIKRRHANHCVCQVEVMEQRRTGGAIKEGVSGDVRIKKQGEEERRDELLHLFMQTWLLQLGGDRCSKDSQGWLLPFRRGRDTWRRIQQKTTRKTTKLSNRNLTW